MNDDERREEGTEEQVEDLEAPADVQDDVAGGAGCQGGKGSCCRKSSCVERVLVRRSAACARDRDAAGSAGAEAALV